MNFNYDTKEVHRKKKFGYVNYIVENYLSGFKSERAILMPGVTWESEKIFAEKGIITADTTYLFFENNNNLSDKSKSFYYEKLKENWCKMFHKKNFSDLKYDEKYAFGIYNGSLHEIKYNVDGDRKEDNFFDFAFYDTCSTLTHVYKWIPRHLSVHKKGSKIMMTFDLDATNRTRGKDIENIISYNKEFNLLDLNDFKCDICSKFTNEIILKKINQKVFTFINFLKHHGMITKFVSIYQEDKTSKVLILLYGEKI